MALCSVYLPPSQNTSKIELDNLFSQLPSPVLLMGNFHCTQYTVGYFHLWQEKTHGWRLSVRTIPLLVKWQIYYLPNRKFVQNQYFFNEKLSQCLLSDLPSNKATVFVLVVGIKNSSISTNTCYLVWYIYRYMQSWIITICAGSGLLTSEGVEMSYKSSTSCLIKYSNNGFKSMLLV